MTNRLSLVGGQVFDGVADEPAKIDVHIVDGRIVDSAPHDAVVVDVAGSTVVPGLIDAHFHAYGIGLTLLSLTAEPMSYVAHKAASRLAATLRRGFTTVRDVAGGDPGLGKALAEGLICGPRYLYTGPALSQTGGHGDPRPRDLEYDPCCDLIGERVDGVDAVRTAVRERFRRGAHAIKLMTSGGVLSPEDPLRIPQYSAEEVRVATEEAARRGSYVAAHAYSPEAIVHSVRNGVRTIEHGNLLDDASARAMSEEGAFLVPTLVTYDAMARRGAGLDLPAVSAEKNTVVLDAGVASLPLARSHGIPIGFGTDLMGDLEDDQLHEFRIRVDVETVSDVLRSATSVNAGIIGRPDLGRIQPGAVADLVVLDGDPWTDASVLWDGEGRRVFQGGREVER